MIRRMGWLLREVFATFQWMADQEPGRLAYEARKEREKNRWKNRWPDFYRGPR